MSQIIINQDRIDNPQAVIRLCPFNAIEYSQGDISINAACKMCIICIKKGPEGAFTLPIAENVKPDISQWKGISIFVDHLCGKIHPVSYELIYSN